MKFLTLILLLISAASAQSVQFNLPYPQREKEFIAAVLVLEAASEGAQGMQAVINVIQNRAGHNNRLLYRVARHPGSFSAVNNLSTDTAIARAKKQVAIFKMALELASDAVSGQLTDLTQGATHYDNVKRFGKPYWARSYRQVAVIGNHVFYRG